MANIEKISVGGTSYDVRDATTLQNLTSAQETTLLNTGTYNGTAVSSGTVFTTDEGKFKEFSASTPTITTKTSITMSGSHAGIGYFKGVYYQIQSNKCYYSDDNCTTWTSTTIANISSSSSAYIYGPANNGSLALVIVNSAIAGSSDGKNWEKLSTVPTAFGNIYCFAGKFYITNNAYNQLYSSSDGITWTQVALPSGVSSTFSITGTATRLVVIPAYNSTWYYTEDNGTNWTPFTPTGVAYSDPSVYTFSSNILGEKTFIKTGSVWNFTTDGTSYTQVSTSAINSLSFPTFDYCSAAGLYVCSDNSSSWGDKYYTSTDGVTWTEQSRPSQQNVCLACSPVSFMMSINGSYSNYPVYFGSLLNLTDLTPTVTVDQTYDSTSANAQSGVAVASALSTKQGALNSSVITLSNNNWSNSKKQSVTVTGMTSTSFVWVSPAPTSANDYASAGVLCIGQSTNSLEFSCETDPSVDISVQVVFGQE